MVFADIDGDGRDDYVVIGSTGSLFVYRNGGPNSGAPDGWLWYRLGPIAGGVAPRENIRLADINGDGKANYLIVDDKTGAVTAYLNGGANPSANLGWVWIQINKIASGIGDGAGVRFADFDGDGKADYAWVSEGGAVTLYLNGGQNSAAPNGWLWVPAPNNPVATGVGAARDEVRFADLDGDGKADYLRMSKLTGAVQLWHNAGVVDSKWIWVQENEVAQGVGANGLSIQYGNILGSGRADYAVVDPVTSGIYLWANGCQGPTGTGPVPTGFPPRKGGSHPKTSPSMSCNDFQGQCRYERVQTCFF